MKTAILSNNGCLIIQEGSTIVCADRPLSGYMRASTNRVAVTHPILGSVTAKCHFTHQTPEINYYPVNGDNVIDLNKYSGFQHRWFEWHSEGSLRPWCLQIVEAWEKLHVDELRHALSETVQIKVLVEYYPTKSGVDRTNFLATVEVPKGKLSWYNQDFPHADGSTNHLIGIADDDGQEVDLRVYFSPDNETYSGYPRSQFGVYFGDPMRVASAPRPLE